MELVRVRVNGASGGLGFEAMNPGTLYRTLRQMEKEGIVESTWETSRGGPARRMYTITDAGRAYLDFWAKSLEQYQKTMDNFFRLYTGRPPRPRAKTRSSGGERSWQWLTWTRLTRQRSGSRRRRGIRSGRSWITRSVCRSATCASRRSW